MTDTYDGHEPEHYDADLLDLSGYPSAEEDAARAAFDDKDIDAQAEAWAVQEEARIAQAEADALADADENPCAEMVGRVLADYGPNGGRALAERGEFPQDTPEETPESPSESLTADDEAPTLPTGIQSVREELSDPARRAYENYSELAEDAPSETAREFWRLYAKNVLNGESE